MFILGLAGVAGAGKDTVADYLVKAYGFVKFAFSDALYREVVEAWHHVGVTQELLRDRATKDTPQEQLTFANCGDLLFVNVMETIIRPIDYHVPLSPRQVLQWWGTEYRRAQQPDYWLNKNEDWLAKTRAESFYPEHAPQYFVNATCRFPNEREWIVTGAHAALWQGNVWHIRREGIAAVAAHVSETPLEVLPRERQLWNNDTIARLHRGVDLLMSTHARFVRVEPMAPNVEPLFTENAQDPT